MSADERLERCFGGAIPAVLATVDADGTPNITYLSRAHRVDHERIALSNQFMSKTARNLAADPRATLLLVDPLTHDQFVLSVVYERTERRGVVFERLRTDVDALAALSGMQDVFRLRAADVFRVLHVEQLPPGPHGADPGADPAGPTADERLAALAELTSRLNRCADLDVLIDAALDGLDRLLGYAHVHLLLLDEDGRRLYTVASRGFDADSIGAEVAVGDGLVGTVAARCSPVRVGNLRLMQKYSASIRRAYSAPTDLPLPTLRGADSRLVVPAMALGQLVGVVVVDSERPVAFGPADEHVVGVVASLLANGIEHARVLERDAGGPVPAAPTAPTPPSAAPAPPAAPPGRARVVVRFYDVDGSTFLDDEHLVKGVAGRILWTLLREHVASGRVDFTNKELRLDPSLDLPGFKDNLESRLLLLKRRLDERAAPVRVERTGRGRFRLVTDAAFELRAAEG